MNPPEDPSLKGPTPPHQPSHSLDDMTSENPTTPLENDARVVAGVLHASAIPPVDSPAQIRFDDADAEPAPAPPTFPTHLLPGFVGDYVRSVAASQDVPETLAALCALGITSLCVGGRLCAENPLTAKRSFGNLFLIGAAASGTGKTEALGVFRRPVDRLQNEARDEWKKASAARKAQITDLENRGKAVERRLAKAALGSDEHEALLAEASQLSEATMTLELKSTRAPALWVEDFSIEVLGVLMQANGQQSAVISADAQRVVQNLRGRNTKGGESDDGAWCKMWSGEATRSDRITRDGVVMDAPRLTLLALSQPDIVRSLMFDPNFYERGLVARILYADTFATLREISLTEGRMKTPKEMDAQWDDFVGRLHRRYYRLPVDAPEVIPMASDAAEALAKLHNAEVQRQRDGDHTASELRSRYAEHAARIAVNLHAMKHEDRAHEHPVDLPTVEASIGILRFFIAFQQPVIEARKRGALKGQIEKVRAHLANKPEGDTARAVGRAAGLRDAPAYERLIAELLDLRVIVELPSPRKNSRCFKLRE